MLFLCSHISWEFALQAIVRNCSIYVSSRWKFWSPRTWLWSSWGQLSWWWHMLLLSTYQQDVLIINISAEEIQHSCTACVIWSISGRHTAPPAITTEVFDDRSQEPHFCRRTITSLFSKVTSRTHRRRWFPPERLKWPPTLFWCVLLRMSSNTKNQRSWAQRTWRASLRRLSTCRPLCMKILPLITVRFSNLRTSIWLLPWFQRFSSSAGPNGRLCYCCFSSLCCFCK